MLVDDSINIAKKASGAPPRDQSIRWLHNYCTSRDHSIFDDPESAPSQRDSRMAYRLARLGVKRASELNLIKWAMVMLTDAEYKISGSWPSYHAIYQRVQDFKSLLQETPEYAGPFLDEYPERPQDLDERIFTIAYDMNDPPITKHMHNYGQLGHHIPLRSNSKLLQTSEVAPQSFAYGGIDLQGALQALLGRSQSGGAAGHNNMPRGFQFVGQYDNFNQAYGTQSWMGGGSSSWGQDRSTMGQDLHILIMEALSSCAFTFSKTVRPWVRTCTY